MHYGILKTYIHAPPKTKHVMHDLTFSLSTVYI